MWLFVLYDLPTNKAEQRRQAARFRIQLLKDGFYMFQFSAYARHCSSVEDAEVHKKRVRSILPPEGSVGMLLITDKQFGEMEVFYAGCEEQKPTPPIRQLELF